MPGFAFPTVGRSSSTSPPSRLRNPPQSSVLCSAKTAKSPSRETSLHEALVARYLACTRLFVSLPITSYRGRLIVAPKCNRATTPGLLISRYTSASGYSARKQMAIPSSQATPMCTCPALRPRRCPEYSRICSSKTAAFQRIQTVGFHSPNLRKLSCVHDYTNFGAQ